MAISSQKTVVGPTNPVPIRPMPSVVPTAIVGTQFFAPGDRVSVPVGNRQKTYALICDGLGRRQFLPPPLTLHGKLKHAEDSVLGWPDFVCEHGYMVWAIKMPDILGSVSSNVVPELLSYFPTPKMYWVSYGAGWRVVPDHALFRAAMRPKFLDLFKAWKRMSPEERDAGENCLATTVVIGGNEPSMIRLPAFSRRLCDSTLFGKWDPDAVPSHAESPPLPTGPRPSDPPRPPEPDKAASNGSGTSTSPLLLDWNSEEGRVTPTPKPAASPGTRPPPPPSADGGGSREEILPAHAPRNGPEKRDSGSEDSLSGWLTEDSDPESEASASQEEEARFTDEESNTEPRDDPEDADYEDLGIVEQKETPPTEAEPTEAEPTEAETTEPTEPTASEGRKTEQNPTRKGGGSAKRNRVDEDADSPPDERYNLNDALRENDAKRRRLTLRLERLETSKKQLSESRRRVSKAKCKLLDACTERMSSFLDRKRTAIDTDAVDGLLSSLERCTSEIRGASRGSAGKEI